MRGRDSSWPEVTSPLHLSSLKLLGLETKCGFSTYVIFAVLFLPAMLLFLSLPV